MEYIIYIYQACAIFWYGRFSDVSKHRGCHFVAIKCLGSVILCLKNPEHGYGIMQRVENMTEGRIKIGPGTMYGTLSKLEAQQLISQVEEVDRKKIYKITDKGLSLLKFELKRLKELIENGVSIMEVKK